jgi:hypothetical protein
MVRKLILLSAMVVVAAPVFAQGGGGTGNFSPEQVRVMMAKGKAWERWRANHKHISALQHTLIAFAELEKDKSTAITKEQAKKMVPVLKQYRPKPKLTDDEAKLVNKKLNDSLTLPQLQKIATVPQMGQGGRGFGGGGRAGGGAGGGAFDPTKIPDPADYNPLNIDTMPFKGMMGAQFDTIKKKSDAFYKSLEDRAK